MDHRNSSGLRGMPVGIIGAIAVAAFAIGFIFLLLGGSKDQTGQSVSTGGAPTEQVKAPPTGTGSSNTTGTAPRNQEGR